jgi:CubicO group peptidase (beta-lactamase class C family)
VRKPGRPFGIRAGIFFLAALSAFGTGAARVGPGSPSLPWKQYASPEEAGFDAAKLAKAHALAASSGSTAVVAVHEGKVLAAWGEVARRIELHSVRKSLVSALVGIYASEGKVRLDKTVGDTGIDDLAPLTDSEKMARLADLLMSKSGVYHPAAKETADVKKNRPARGSHAPGEFFWYNNWDFNTAGAILEKEAGIKLFEAFKERLADPAGMEDFRVSDGYEQYERTLSHFPAHAFRMSARDLARFGQVFATGGRAAEKQVVPPAWVKESTSPKTPVRPGTAYGFMWWAYPKGGLGADYPELDRYDKFAAIGSGGQLVLVVPEAGFVFVHLADTDYAAGVGGKAVWGIAEAILASKTGPAKSSPSLVDLRSEPFAKSLPARRERVEVPVARKTLESYAGEYVLSTGAKVSIRLYGGQLAGEMMGQEIDLFPESETRFFAKAAEVEIVFAKDDRGAVTGLSFNYGGRTQTAAKSK